MYYVSSRGDDTNMCLIASPCRTVSRAVPVGKEKAEEEETDSPEFSVKMIVGPSHPPDTSAVAFDGACNIFICSASSTSSVNKYADLSLQDSATSLFSLFHSSAVARFKSINFRLISNSDAQSLTFTVIHCTFTHLPVRFR